MYVQLTRFYPYPRDLRLPRVKRTQDYLDIAEKTGASTATISRVNRSLNYGNDGYDRVFERLGMLEKESEDNK